MTQQQNSSIADQQRWARIRGSGLDQDWSREEWTAIS